MKNIVIYTSNSCGYCHMAKDYFNEINVTYTEKNVSEDPAARKELMKMGYMSVPVIKIEEEIVVGFDKAKIEELLK